MKKKVIILVIVFLSLGTSVMARELPDQITYEQRVFVRYRLFETNNARIHLLLDSATGRIWQVVHDVNQRETFWRVAINPKSFLNDDEKEEIGRFTLYSVKNVWGFLLLDQKTGDVWRGQFAPEAEDRFIRKIPAKFK